MLPAEHRLRQSTDFATVVRSGRRVRSGAIVVHQHADLSAGSEALVGLVVGRGVGGSVIRHRVSRRLRAQLATRLALLPECSGTVVRALPPAASATSGQLGGDLDSALARLAARR